MKTVPFIVALLCAVLVVSDSMGQPPGSPRGFEEEGSRGRGRFGEDGPGQRRGEFGPGGPGGGRRGGNPLMAALDTDQDGKLSEDEINNASASLRKLDRNEDGVVDAREIQPRGGRRGQGEEGRRRQGDFGRSERGRPGGPEGMDPVQMTDRIMQRFDANQDDKLSGKEIPERMSRAMNILDTNGDGALSRSELGELGALRERAGRGGRRGSDGQGVRPRRPEPEDEN